MIQVLINICVQSALIYIISLSFSLIYSSTKEFQISFAGIISISGYFFLLFYQLTASSFVLSVLLSIFLCVFLGLFFEYTLYRNLRKLNISRLNIFLSSIGLYIVIQNLISLLFGDSTRAINPFQVVKGFNILGGFITGVQLIILLSAILVSLVYLVGLNFSNIGVKIKAIDNNYFLAKIYGIPINRIVTVIVIFSSITFGMVGILSGFDTNINPSFGFNLLFSGLVAMILAGVGGQKRLFFSSLVISGAQNFTGFLINSLWMEAIAYVMLILVLILNPYGFSGDFIRKNQV